MYAVYDFWDILLVVEIGQFEDEDLRILLSTQIHQSIIGFGTQYFWQLNSFEESEKPVDIIRVPELKFLGLEYPGHQLWRKYSH